jgi:phosphopantothenoylcysteine decarboxylase/phosphopantothenate--cysteine ligase
MAKKIIIGICGSIAAYKSIDLAKLLIEHGFEVELILSESAAAFVSELTLRSLFPGRVYLHDELLSPQDKILHIELAKAAALLLIAPASANFIAKLAHAQANCLLSEICLATKAPIMVAPAMNKEMWANSLMQSNLSKLREHKIEIIGPGFGSQACGDYGAGRMLEPAEILEHVKATGIPKLFKDKSIVITAGPTQEKIDPVRYLSNYSSGKMGYALAKIAHFMGAQVTLISGETNLTPPSGVRFIKAQTAEQMLKAALETAVTADIFIGAAAVADYKPTIYHQQKLKKTEEILELRLEKNTDIITNIKRLFPSLLVVGFAAETDNLEINGLKKLQAKNLDMLAINDVSSGKAFGQDENELQIITSNNRSYHLAKNSKDKIAQGLLEIIARSSL